MINPHAILFGIAAYLAGIIVFAASADPFVYGVTFAAVAVYTLGMQKHPSHFALHLLASVFIAVFFIVGSLAGALRL